ncbi:MAG: ATP-binding protein, partial [Calditrichaeota bacterium]|nr:ATP-binding protein [Calditrichota bacterium]
MELLRAAWERINQFDKSEPQLVVLLGESGLGKTRVTQEFYNWLSMTHDASEPNGYWPDDLGQKESNLKINPDPEACDNGKPMPFLWWGIRLSDPSARNTIYSGGAISTYLNYLIPHLEPVS